MTRFKDRCKPTRYKDRQAHAKKNAETLEWTNARLKADDEYCQGLQEHFEEKVWPRLVKEAMDRGMQPELEVVSPAEWERRKSKDANK